VVVLAIYLDISQIYVVHNCIVMYQSNLHLVMCNFDLITDSGLICEVFGSDEMSQMWSGFYYMS